LNPLFESLHNLDWTEEVRVWNELIDLIPQTAPSHLSWTTQAVVIELFAHRIGDECQDADMRDWIGGITNRAAAAAIPFAAIRAPHCREGLIAGFVSLVRNEMNSDPMQLLNEGLSSDWAFVEALSHAIRISLVRGEPPRWLTEMATANLRPLFGWDSDREDPWASIYRVAWLGAAAAVAADMARRLSEPREGLVRFVRDLADANAEQWANEQPGYVPRCLKQFFVETTLLQLTQGEPWRAYRLTDALNVEALHLICERIRGNVNDAQLEVFAAAEQRARYAERGK
jgi:hypothetical protein